MSPNQTLSSIKIKEVNKLDKHILSVLATSTVPLSAEDVRERLEVKGLHYSRQHLKRRLNTLAVRSITEIVGKRNKTELYKIIGQVMEPWEATTLVTSDPMIEMGGKYYTPDHMARAIRTSSWPMLNRETETELKSLLQLMIMGSAAYPTLKAHSILPVGHVRKTVEDFNARLKVMCKVIDTILSHERIRDGSTGNHISNETKDLLLEDLESFITNFGVNVRSDINEE